MRVHIIILMCKGSYNETSLSVKSVCSNTEGCGFMKTTLMKWSDWKKTFVSIKSGSSNWLSSETKSSMESHTKVLESGDPHPAEWESIGLSKACPHGVTSVLCYSPGLSCCVISRWVWKDLSAPSSSWKRQWQSDISCKVFTFRQQET